MTSNAIREKTSDPTAEGFRIMLNAAELSFPSNTALECVIQEGRDPEWSLRAFEADGNGL